MRRCACVRVVSLALPLGPPRCVIDGRVGGTPVARILRLDQLGDEKLTVPLGQHLGLRIEHGDQIVVVLDTGLADQQIRQVEAAGAREHPQVCRIR